jgi:hypothetical protein
MLITKVSQLTGKENTRDIPISEDRYNHWLENKQNLYIQRYFADLSASDREFLLTGATPEEWDELEDKHNLEDSE